MCLIYVCSLPFDFFIFAKSHRAVSHDAAFNDADVRVSISLLKLNVLIVVSRPAAPTNLP